VWDGMQTSDIDGAKVKERCGTFYVVPGRHTDPLNPNYQWDTTSGLKLARTTRNSRASTPKKASDTAVEHKAGATSRPGTGKVAATPKQDPFPRVNRSISTPSLRPHSAMPNKSPAIAEPSHRPFSARYESASDAARTMLTGSPDKMDRARPSKLAWKPPTPRTAANIASAAKFKIPGMTQIGSSEPERQSKKLSSTTTVQTKFATKTQVMEAPYTRFQRERMHDELRSDIEAVRSLV